MRVSSIWASAKPMQLRAPRLKGTHAMSASALRSSGGSTKRSGSKRSGSSQAARVAPGEVGRRQHERALPDAVATDDDVGGRHPRGHDTGGVQPGRLAHHPVGEVEPPERRLVDDRRRAEWPVDRRRPRPAAAPRGRVSRARAPDHPRQGRRRRVEAGAHERADLVADLGVGERAVDHERLEHVERVTARLRPDGRDLLVEDGVDGGDVGPDPGPTGAGERVGQLRERRDPRGSPGPAGTGRRARVARPARRSPKRARTTISSTSPRPTR